MNNTKISEESYVRALQESVENYAVSNAKLTALVYDLQAKVSDLSEKNAELTKQVEGDANAEAKADTQKG